MFRIKYHQNKIYYQKYHIQCEDRSTFTDTNRVFIQGGQKKKNKTHIPIIESCQ